MRNSVLVIGAGGFIGKSLCRALSDQGAHVKAIVRSKQVPNLSTAEQITSECSNPADLAALLKGVDALVYLAANSTPGSSAGKPLAELNTNLLPLLVTLEALQSNPSIPLVYFSSAGAIYDEHAVVASGETDLPRPRSYHGAAKVAAEQFIGAWTRQFAGCATIIRPSNIYGPGQAEVAGFGIVPTMLGCIRRGETLHVWGDGATLRDYLYIDDLIGLTLAALKAPPEENVRTINAASGESISLNELFTLAESACGETLHRDYVKGRNVDADKVIINIDYARQVLGWQPEVSLDEGLKRTWHWLHTTRP